MQKINMGISSRPSHKVKTSDQHLIFYVPALGHTIKINCITFQTVDPDICPILIFDRRVWD